MTHMSSSRSLTQSTKTLLLYQHDLDNLGNNVHVVSCVPFNSLNESNKAMFYCPKEEFYVVITDQTAFVPEGEGQGSDGGLMRLIPDEQLQQDNEDADLPAMFTVTQVRTTADGVVLHLGEFGWGSFSRGDKVQLRVNPTFREMHSKLHSAGHILGLAVRCLASTLGEVVELEGQYYFGRSFVEYRGLIDEHHREAIEKAANDIVEEDLPIAIRWWTSEELGGKCSHFSHSVTVSEGELTRAVEFEGAGAYSCGGTHMPRTKDVGPIDILDISHENGTTKISFGLGSVIRIPMN
ncbi:hypothetical protein FSARC_6511 [Fusarium sarcochroum]|uniref:Alanyl-transfer RNA synthetases family profile domain-containing protein n=1 Tax=Fusarium sarcochroum TaxID=1208366 RepID=A0A8H4TX22_9HYPO|nr:hypothetical protein FSARC_6511 [Fusarium sarcochroum]